MTQPTRDEVIANARRLLAVQRDGCGLWTEEEQIAIGDALALFLSSSPAPPEEGKKEQEQGDTRVDGQW